MASLRRHKKQESDTDSIVFYLDYCEDPHGFAGLPYYPGDGYFSKNGVCDLDTKNMFREPEDFSLDESAGRYKEGAIKI